ncbi:MAG: UDP-N-acetylmuramoyl-L-alanyl-D-glutamate--2,6-diaminopimelate ligase [Bacilli bacterium]|nr:UDP-N-acetylmuramoyl-L-alanyl-D-glutamate--2,6-diaminopimelate ligase [Bacilli bacterium]
MFKFESDSRKVQKGQTFIALKGLTVDGHDFIESAIKNGASKIICEKDIDFDIPYEEVEDTDKYLREILHREYGEKLNEMKLIGVTGTNGKTTSCYLTYQMLLNMGIDAAYIGTIGYYHKDEHIELNNTTPDILTVYKLLMNAYESGAKTVVMEVSSQALSYDRLTNINYSIIGFTNLTEDHLDYHKTMENYLNAKLLILNHLTKDAVIIVNSDDEASVHFKKEGHKRVSFGLNGDYKIINFETHPSETNLTFSFEGKTYDVLVPLTSKFNVYNYLTVVSILNQYGFGMDEIVSKTSMIKAPKGRCEAYKVNGGVAVIDYAHTPDAVEKVITAYNELKKNRVITLVGCGGDRDPKKRPIMGEIVSRLSDYVIFTSDNPRTEDPQAIMNDILEGVKKDNYEVILDRRQAIKHGIDIMEKDDILLILGKGHEDYQIIGKEKIHLDDVEEVLNYKSN